MMGHALGRELKTTPMEAMLRSVRVAAGQAAWYDSKVSEAPDDDAVAPGGSHYHWVEAAKEAHRSSVSFSAIALRSGLAKILVEQVTAQAQVLALSTGRPLRLISEAVIKKTVAQFNDSTSVGGRNRAELHFEALKRVLDRSESDYAN